MSEVNNGAEAAGFARFNFATASSQDSIVLGAERAGMRNEFDTPGAIPTSAMAEWREFMKEQGVTRGISLMSEEEMSWFPEPGLLAADVLPRYDHAITLCRQGSALCAIDPLTSSPHGRVPAATFWRCCARQRRRGRRLWCTVVPGSTAQAWCWRLGSWSATGSRPRLPWRRCWRMPAHAT
mmetsp:Transcript_148848/g.478141  ORF Transcript_148848/g.478141 Transcript_148848/m.478141 type:complete len:181 (+) Transcript_148848:94-636(+)